MFKFLKYNFLNFFWYYKVRDVNIPNFNYDGVNIKDVITQIMLESVGLMISDIQIPRYVYLSKIQRRAIDNVSHYGYKVGLLVKNI